MKIYRRFRAVRVGDGWQEAKTGKWRYVVVEEGRGKRTGDLEPPFYICPQVNGKQNWQRLSAESYADAKNEVARREHAEKATGHGVVVMDANHEHPLRAAIADFLDKRASKAPKTVAQYRHALNEFADLSGANFVEAVTNAVLHKYQKAMVAEYSFKTYDTRYTIVRAFLKAYGNTAFIPATERPEVEEEPATPYTPKELEKLFAAMDEEQRIRYKFFLGTGCRDREVSFAAWDDLDLERGVYHVRRKEDVGFTPKKHESRKISVPTSLVAALKKRHEKHAGERWVFLSARGNPDNHFLRKLKGIALDAGLNCGHCKTAITVGEGKARREEHVTCKTHPVCAKFFLHRFRKTCATNWQDAGIPVRTIQEYLGHKSLEVTQKYLGVTTPSQSQIDRAFGD